MKINLRTNGKKNMKKRILGVFLFSLLKDY